MQMMQKKYSMVHVHWGAAFKKTGDKPIETRRYVYPANHTLETKLERR
jgi:hypothetical protein